KIIAWRCHFHDQQLTEEVAQAAAELDVQKRVSLYRQMQQQAWERSPIVFMLQQNDVTVARKSVVGFQLGAQADFTRYDKIRKPCLRRSSECPLVYDLLPVRRSIPAIASSTRATTGKPSSPQPAACARL